MKTIVTGFLGCGNIGTGVLRLLDAMSGEIAARHGIRFDIRRILVRDPRRVRDAAVPPALLTGDPRVLLDDPDISLVVECLGGEEPAATYLLRALEAGKDVVTANKMALAANWQRLMRAGQRHGASLAFEASVLGAVPAIKTLRESLQANRVEALTGILNGTTNHILSAMSLRGVEYDEALAEARRLGLAEPDPSSDVDGFDAVYKLSILASLAFHAHVPWQGIHREGIRGITAQDIAFGRELGYTLKLLAHARLRDGTLEARVHPAFIPHAHPLAAVGGSFNALFLRGHACREMMLYGRGAGPGPTAGAVLSDMIGAAVRSAPPLTQGSGESGQLVPRDDWDCEFYIRFAAADQPGVLGHVATCFGREGVSIETLMQRNPVRASSVPIVMITHRAREKDVQRALAGIDAALAVPESLIRVDPSLPGGEGDA